MRKFEDADDKMVELRRAISLEYEKNVVENGEGIIGG